MADNQLSEAQELSAEKDFAHLQAAVQRYMESCGYMGTQNMSYATQSSRKIRNDVSDCL